MSVRDLIHRMTHGDFEAAREEARKIADLDALDEIRAILDKARKTPEKTYCYWILGDLGRNTGAGEVMDYLVERVARENKVAKLRKQALMEIEWLNGPTDPSNIIEATKDKNRDVRHSAIDALGACTHPKAEEALIDIISVKRRRNGNRAEAAIALARIGTDRCSETLTGLIHRLPRNRAYETAVAASLLGLARIGSSEALPLAVEELGKFKSPFPNWASMLVIEQLGSEDQIDLVIDRLTSSLKTKNRHDVAYTINFIDTKFDDEFSAGAAFLNRFDDPRVKEFFALLREEIDLLFDREKNFLARNIPGFEEYVSDDDTGRWLSIG